MKADLKDQDLRTGEWLTHKTLGLCQFIHFDNEDCTTCTIYIHGMWHRGEQFKEMHRKMIKDHKQAELVDVIVRSLDALRWMNADIDNTMACVMRYNKLRPPKHGKLY